jgi:hypothetical protein
MHGRISSIFEAILHPVVEYEKSKHLLKKKKMLINPLIL